MFFLVCPIFQAFSQREKMKKIIEILGIPKFEEIDYMSNQEYSFIQSTEENIKNYNKLKDILLPEEQETNYTSINSTIKKIIYEIIFKCFNYNRNKRISIDDIISQIDYLYDRYIKEKPMKIDSMNIINKDNLMQLNAPILSGNINTYKIKQNIKNNTNNYNNNSGSYLIPIADDNKINNNKNNNNDNVINISKLDNDISLSISNSQQKNYDSFMSERYSSVIDNNNNEIEDKKHSINNKCNKNNNKNFSKFCSLSSISSNKNYNKGHYISITTNNGNNNYNFSNISEKLTDRNSYINNNSEQSLYTPTEIDNQIKKNNDEEYTKLQNRKFIFLNYIF